MAKTYPLRTDEDKTCIKCKNIGPAWTYRSKTNRWYCDTCFEIEEATMRPIYDVLNSKTIEEMNAELLQKLLQY